MIKSSIPAFIRLGRPHFLAGGLLLHGLGVAIALYSGQRLNVAALLWGQVAITSVQWMTHYANEFFDQDADRANPFPTRWAGGSRVLLAGLVQPGAALMAALILAGMALLASLVLALAVQTGPWTVPLISLALALSWAYSAPPWRLHSRALGELTIALVVAGLTPVVGTYLQMSRLPPVTWLAVAPLCCLQFAQALAIELADLEGDAAVGKRTLVVRLGRRPAAFAMVAAYGLAYGALLLLFRMPLPVTLALTLTLPVALWLCWRLLRGAYASPADWDSIAFWGIALVMGTAGLQLLAFLAFPLMA